MDDPKTIARVKSQLVRAETFVTGIKGNGIKSMKQNGSTLEITLDAGETYRFNFPNWWFGTREEYNAMSPVQRNGYYFCFIEEGT